MKKSEDSFIITDRLLLAAFAGFIAALAANISLFLINQVIPGQNVNMPQITIGFFLNDGVSQSLFILTLGVIWSTVVGGAYALIYLVALDLTGWHNLWLKAVIVVNGTWLFGAGFIINLLNIADYTRAEPLSIAAFYIAHLLFATYLYLLVHNFGRQSVLNETGVEKRPYNLKLFNKRKQKRFFILKPARKVLHRDTGGVWLKR